MMQGMSVSTLTTSGNSGVYGLTPLWRSHFKLKKSTLPPASGIGKQCLMHQCVQCLFYKVHPDIPRKRNFRVEAGWPFKGGDQGLDQSSERSESANEDILIFFFQLDLATRVQVWHVVFCLVYLSVSYIYSFFLSVFLSKVVTNMH